MTPTGPARPWEVLLCSAVLAAAVAIQVGGLGHRVPLLDGHGIRQTETAMVARNFWRGGYRLLRPEVDWGGGGVFESELQLYPFLVAILYGAAGGVREAAGRSLSVFLGLAAALAFWRFTRATLGRAEAAVALVLYALSPLSLFYGRAVQSEALLMALILVGLEAFRLAAATEAPLAMLTATACWALAGAIKPTALVVGLPALALLVEARGWRALTAIKWWAVAAVALAAPAAWYWHAHRLGVASGLSIGLWSAEGYKWASWDFLTSGHFWRRMLVSRPHREVLTLPVYVLFWAGLLATWRDARYQPYRWWLAGLAASILVVAKGHFRHDYYQWPLVAPAAAVAAGPLVAWWRARWRPAQLALAVVFLTLWPYRIWRPLRAWSAWPAHLPAAAQAIRSVVPEGERVVAADQRSLQLLYYTDRRGWLLLPHEVSAERLDALRTAGACYLISTELASFSLPSEAAAPILEKPTAQAWLLAGGGRCRHEETQPPGPASDGS